MANQITRRDFGSRLSGLLAAGVAASSGSEVFAAARRKLPVAAVVTEYRNNSHADVIVGKVLEGWRQDGQAGPDLRLVSMYTDQVPKGDLSRGLAEKHRFPIVKTIEQAIRQPGGDDRIEGVLSIGEHGNYPYTKKTRQHMYPRRRFFDEIVAAMQKAGRIVPVFSDKHLGWKFSDALHMVKTARKLKIPFMAGSSLPTCWRYPSLTLERGVEIEEAMAVGYGGLEAYGFHTLETLQCMIERRKGGETGVGAVQAVSGDALVKARKAGRWSQELLEAALGSLPAKFRTKQAIGPAAEKHATAYLMEHRDGLRSSVVMANGFNNQFCFAAKLKGRKEPVAVWFRLEEGKPFGHFEHLLRAIEEMFHTGRPAYPVERTLMTTGVLDRVMHSVAEKGRRYETPELAFQYQPTEWGFANK
tara:strand:+ start:1714 stop:2961 length:1248 start_codon:yes stop_codon:yes gene_type:complete